MQPGGGLVVMSDGFVRVHRHTIIAATARHKIPTVYPLRLNAADGGLLAYGSYYVDLRPPPLALLMERTKKGPGVPLPGPNSHDQMLCEVTVAAIRITGLLKACSAREAMVLNSVMRVSKGSAERRRRRLESIKPPGPIVEASKQTEATTQPADDGNI
jgi:hypothetical protein